MPAAATPLQPFWAAFLPAGLAEYRFPAGATVLDVGCGQGDQSLQLREAGHPVIGIDPRPEIRSILRTRALPAAAAKAELLPIRTGSCGAVLCKVVTPYADERLAIGEIGRVLCEGGVAYVIHHGAGYYVRYLFRPESWRHRLYALRTLANTWCYALTRRRLPGRLGDTLYQSARRLRAEYASARLQLVERAPSRRFLGLPVFIADRLQRRT